MMISLFFLLILFAGAATLVGLIAFAIAGKKLWIIPVTGTFVLFGLIAIGLFLSIAIPTANSNIAVKIPSATQVIQDVDGVTRTVIQSPPSVAYNGLPTPFWAVGFKWSRVLLFLVLGSVLAVMVLRRIMSPHACRVGRAWPLVALIIFLAVTLIGGVRTDYRVTEATRAAAAANQEAAEMAARQQIMMANQSAVIASQVSQQVAQSDIHEEMDKFDAPKIPIPPEAPSPAAPAPNAQPPATASPSGDAISKADEKSVAKLSKDDAAKPATASNHKRKKSDKTPASSDAKQSQLVAQTKPADASSAKKDITPSDKSATITEAKPEKSTARPAWVNQPPKRTGNTRREVIATDDYATIEECYQAADVYLLLKTYNRIQQLAGRAAVESPLPSLAFEQGKILVDGTMYSPKSWVDDRLSILRGLGIGSDYVRREIVAKDPKDNESREYIETVQRSFGPMKKLYLQIEFTPAVDRQLLQHWDTSERRDRFAMVGVGAGSVLGFIGLVFGLLKMDTWTKGYYTKRLFIGVPAAIIAGFLLLVMLVSHSVTR
jgi:hypothetical protein